MGAYVRPSLVSVGQHLCRGMAKWLAVASWKHSLGRWDLRALDISGPLLGNQLESGPTRKCNRADKSETTVFVGVVSFYGFCVCLTISEQSPC